MLLTPRRGVVRCKCKEERGAGRETKMSQIKSEILSYLSAIEGELYPVYEFVVAYGEDAKTAIMELWREKRVRMVAISDYRDFSQEQLAQSIEGVEETIGYVRLA
jgi:hypothetical protein